MPVTRGPLRRLSLEQLTRRTSLKWRAYPEDVLPLWVAEMDVALAEPVVAAVSEAMVAGDTGYSCGGDYAEAYAGFARTRWGWDFDPALTRPVPDVMQGVAEVLRLVTDPGDPVVVNVPVYTPFFAVVERTGRRVLEAPLGADGRIHLPVLEDTFRTARDAGGRAAYLLCSPHNPTGTVHTATELAAVVGLAGEYGVRLVVDEIHAPLVYSGHRHLPLLAQPGAEHAIALVSASKAWNLAGLKSAIAVAGTAAGDDLMRMPYEVGYGVSHVATIAHVAALRDGVPWLDTLLADLDENRRLLADLLAERLPSVGYRIPEGTYLAWLDLRALGLGEDPAEALARRARVALSPGPAFGTGGAGHARLNLATTPQILTEAVRRIAASL